MIYSFWNWFIPGLCSHLPFTHDPSLQEATEIVETVLESYIITRSAESQGKTDVLKALEVDSQLTDGTFLDEFKKRKQCEKQREEEEVSLGGTTLVLGEENPTQDRVAILFSITFFFSKLGGTFFETKSRT